MNSTTFHAQLVTPGPWASPRTATSFLHHGLTLPTGKSKVFLLCLALRARVNGRKAPRRRERGCVRPSTQADCWEKLALPDTQFTKTLIIRRRRDRRSLSNSGRGEARLHQPGRGGEGVSTQGEEGELELTNAVRYKLKFSCFRSLIFESRDQRFVLHSEVFLECLLRSQFEVFTANNTYVHFPDACRVH
ncbi:hypothetical protein E2C01_023000 [Portunus trituberculatus]|uniref:Uncharacterized protein n=1 Tax=Portunus trituberculatus TaxID=210409 RepID=A0A5B7E6W8_PORTR|nr:hypothetical protein [Portunus trituberculatus]